MSEATETIGVDLGGTKVQVGVLAGVETLWESREGSREQSQDELVELIVREIEAARGGAPRRRRRRPRHPGDDQPGARRSDRRGQPAAGRTADPRPDLRARRPAGLPRQRRQRRRPRRVPLRRRARQADDGDADDRHRDRRRADPRRPDLPRRDRGGGRARPRRDPGRRPAVPGQLPEPRLRRVARLGDGARPRGPRRRRIGARLGDRQAARRRGGRSTGSWSPRRRSPATRPRSASST